MSIQLQVNINVTVHIKSAINVHTVAANINVTVHIKSAINVHTVAANINVTFHITALTVYIYSF